MNKKEHEIYPTKAPEFAVRAGSIIKIKNIPESICERNDLTNGQLFEVLRIPFLVSGTVSIRLPSGQVCELHSSFYDVTEQHPINYIKEV